MFKLLRGRRLRFVRGAVIGGALVYFLDPEQGRARRAKAADQLRDTGQRLMEQVNQGGDTDPGEIWTGGDHDSDRSEPPSTSRRVDDSPAVATPS